MMLVTAQIAVIFVSMFVIFFVIELVWRKRMKEKHAFLALRWDIFYNMTG